MAEPPNITILFLGDQGCGKSTFLSRISQGNTKLEGGPLTLLDDLDQPFIYNVRLLNKPYRFQFYDTSSPTQWTMLGPNVIVLCFDISSQQSLIDMQRIWMKEIKTHFTFDKDFTAEKEIPVLVLGLKRDLRSRETTTGNGIMSPQELRKIAQQMDCDKYMECSAVTGELLQETFEDICKTAIKAATEKGRDSEGACTAM